MASVTVSSWDIRRTLQNLIETSAESPLRIYVKAVDGQEYQLFEPFTVADDHISYRLGQNDTYKFAIMPYSSIVQIMV